MDCEGLVDFMARYHPRIKVSEGIRRWVMAKLRFLAYMVMKGYRNIRAAYRSLTEEDFIKLGFDIRPSYESLREIH